MRPRAQVCSPPRRRRSKRLCRLSLPEQASTASIDNCGSAMQSATDTLLPERAWGQRSNTVADHRARERPRQAARTLRSTDFAAASERRQLAARRVQAPARLAPASSTPLGSFTTARTSPTCFIGDTRVCRYAPFSRFCGASRVGHTRRTRRPMSHPRRVPMPYEPRGQAWPVASCATAPTGRPRMRSRPHHLPTVSCLALSAGLR